MHWPKEFQERVAFLFTIGMVPYVALLEVIIVSNYYYSPKESVLFWLHFFSLMFLTINISGNLYYLITKRSSIKGLMVSHRSESHWRYCTVCETHAPPRSYHCPTCDTCILKRDHHCLFTGTCVGFHNQRYYICTVVYFAIAAIYASLFNFPYLLHEFYADYSLVSRVLSFVFPLFAWLLRFISFTQLWLTLTASVCVAGAMLLIALAGFHMGLLLKNRTTHERAHGITDFDLGWRGNVIAALGKRWYWAILWPWIQSDLPGDGIVYVDTNGLPVCDLRKSK